ncbi:AraC family transcriptional regulator [Granulicella arctica]|uniref:AraC family transcriptional regulator n=1 Tax=Granulicella arctica TaxID=940613 RepID=UPI0021DF9FF5|nr:AraC family transcriptional regulator [Granulicella arctica]
MQELAAILARHATDNVISTSVPGLTLYHFSRRQSASMPLIYTPMVCVMAQGEKHVALGNRIFRYAANDYLISSLDLPVTGTILRSSEKHPYLSFSLAIEQVALSEMVLNLPALSAAEPACALAIGKVDAPLYDAFLRLVRLLDEPAMIATLAPLITREIFYRLLRGQHGSMLRQPFADSGRTAQIANAIRWIRSHFDEPFSSETLAEAVHMSIPSLNRHFRAVTAMSPLQYQKHIRLQEARRLLIAEGQDAATAAFNVGYASPSQFSREYVRAFGAPPRADAERLRYAPVSAVA